MATAVSEDVVWTTLTASGKRQVHLIGAAGSGMQALAAVLAGLGWRVTGSDAALSTSIPGTHAGHSADHVDPHTDVVIYSDAVNEENIELRAASHLGIPTLRYPQALGELMSRGRGLAVTGTHGKSTTTAMAGQILRASGLGPTVIYGANPRGQTLASGAGRGPWVLAEGCEFRENFLHLLPEVAVITGIEADHFDCFPDRPAVQRAFTRLVERLPKETGLLLVRDDCRVSRQIAAGWPGRCQTFGFSPEADWQADELRHRDGKYRFKLRGQGIKGVEVRLQVAGRHNVLNALAAAALARAAGADVEGLVRGLGSFSGLKRRIEIIGRRRGVNLMDDYAHHPTAVAATLQAIRQLHPAARVWCVFQPHQVLRTRCLLDEFARSLQNAEHVAIAPIVPARETRMDGAETRQALVERTRSYGTSVSAADTSPAIRGWLEEALCRGHLADGDVVITMGAGDVWKINHGFADRL